MIKLYDGQISDLLANGAKHNPEIKALSYAVLKEKQRIIDQTQKTRTLALIDELPETILNILAVELRTPFYQEDFAIKTKRELIKDTLIYYTYMGTPEAVNRMLSAVFPGSYIEEWYTYGGEPYHFQVILEMSDFRECADAATIIKGVKKVKRLTAHMDGLIYQCNIGIVIGTHGQGYKYRANWTGRTEAGTEPRRNKRGGFDHEELEIAISAKGFDYKSPAAGTAPWRDVRGGIEHEELEIGSNGKGWAYYSEFSGKVETGTEPYRNTKGSQTNKEMGIAADAQGFGFSSALAGTEPYRAKSAKIENAEIDVLSEGKPYSYSSDYAGQTESGTAPSRGQHFAKEDEELQVVSTADSFTYAVKSAGKVESGTEPQRSAKGGEMSGAFFTVADGESYRYRITMCGTSYCNNKRRRSLC